MTLVTQQPRVVITGNSSLGPYSLVDENSVAIRFVSTSHVKLTRYSSTTAETGTELVLNTDFTVGGTQDARTFTLIGSQAVLTSSQRIVAERSQTYVQDLDLTTGGAFNAESVETRFDKVAEYLQELKKKVDRRLEASPLDSTPSTMPLKANADSGDLLAYDASKNLTPVSPTSVGISSVLLGTGWSTLLLLAAVRAMGFYNVLAYGATGDGTTNDSTAIQSALDACEAGGGGVVYFPEATYICKNLTVASNTTLLGDGKTASILKLPAAAIYTDTILLNETTASFTNSGIRILSLGFDGNGAQQSGSQTRFSELVGFGRVTNLKVIDCLFKNVGYIGLAIGSCRDFEIDVDLEDCGFNGATSNGGPALFVSRVGSSDDMSEGGEITFRAKDCFWHGATIHGRRITIKYMKTRNVKEASLFAPGGLPASGIINEDMTIEQFDCDGVTEHDISGSHFEIGGERINIGSGVGAHSDHNVITFSDVQDGTITGPIIAKDYNEDSLASTPQAAAVGIISNSASPANPRNIRISGVRCVNTARTATVTITNASPAVITWTAHKLSPNDRVVFTTTGALPTGLTAATPYYVIQDGLTDDTFRVSASRGGTVINTSSAGSGTHTGTKSTLAYAAFAASGSGDVATDVIIEGNDAGIDTLVGSALVTTKLGAGSAARNNVNMTDFAVTPTIAGDSTINLASTDLEYVEVSGTSFTCTALGTALAGTKRRVRFTGSGGILTHNGTSLILPGAENAFVRADSVYEFHSLGSGNWICTNSKNFETGTFTPTLSLVTAGSSSFAYGQQTGVYKRYGRHVYVEVKLVFTPTIGTGSGDLVITDALPFTALSGGSQVISLPASEMNGFWTWPTSATQVYALPDAGAATSKLYGMGSTINSTTFGAAHMTSGSQHTLQFKGWYRL